MGTATGQDCPASYAQQAMWHAYQLASRSGGALYHVAIRATADGPLDVAELRRALEALTDRHPALRSTFAPAGDGLIQRLHESRPVDLAVLDTAGWTKREVDAAVQAEAPGDGGPSQRRQLGAAQVSVGQEHEGRDPDGGLRAVAGVGAHEGNSVVGNPQSRWLEAAGKIENARASFENPEASEGP